jgi:hypothetical protein
MKLLIGLAIVLGLGLYAFYHMGGYSSMDPTEQGKQAMAAIRPGMTWQEVIQATKVPGRYRSMMAKKEPDGTEVFVPAGVQKFDLDSFKAAYDGGGMNHGFVFVYVYSDKASFDVDFDDAGKVEFVSRLPGMSDLLQTR